MESEEFMRIDRDLRIAREQYRRAHEEAQKNAGEPPNFPCRPDVTRLAKALAEANRRYREAIDAYGEYVHTRR